MGRGENLGEKRRDGLCRQLPPIEETSHHVTSYLTLRKSVVVVRTTSYSTKVPYLFHITTEYPRENRAKYTRVYEAIIAVRAST